MQIIAMDFSGVAAFEDADAGVPNRTVATLQTPDGPKAIRLDMLDFPTAWAIQSRGGIEHHHRCSSVPGWHPMSGPAFLCDCHAVPDEWKRIASRARIIAALSARQVEG